MTQNEELSYDVVIVGGGLSGVLTAARLAATGKYKIALLERDSILGGRLRHTDKQQSSYSYGLNAISPQLFDFWNQILKRYESEMDLNDIHDIRQGSFGVLAANKISQTDCENWLNEKGARILGGYTARRQWSEVDKIICKDPTADEATESAQFGKKWSLTRKVPAAVVLEHMAQVWGIPDVWAADTNAISARGGLLARAPYYGDWDLPFSAIVDAPLFKEHVNVFTDCFVVGSNYTEESGWTIISKAGEFQSKKLVVAHAPWQALAWLKADHWPKAPLTVASKTKPVSVVVITSKVLEKTIELPEITIVPSEKCQIIKTGENEICFQATIDFELSLQAPVVVNALKRLKRARKKLLNLDPGLKLEGEHVALQPVAWAQSPVSKDSKMISRLGKHDFNQPHLAFCGDAYGGDYNGDENITSSVTYACEVLIDNSEPAAAN